MAGFFRASLAPLAVCALSVLLGAGAAELGASGLLRPGQASAARRRGAMPEALTPLGSEPRTKLAVTRTLEPIPEVREAEPDAWAEHDPSGSAWAEGRIIHGATPHRLLLFTFDDGPNRRTTPKLLDTLDAAGIKAVFFVNTYRVAGRGQRVAEQAEVLRDIAARGHLIGNHTVNHEQLPLLETEDAREEILEAEHAIARILGTRPWLFRPPGGARSARIDALLAERGYTQVLWNLGSGDFQVRTPEEVVDTWLRVLERRERENGERGGIVLLHDTYEWSVEAVPMLLDAIAQKNCALLRAGEELYDIVDDPALFFAARGDAGPSAEAAPADPPAAVIEARQAELREQLT
ncbi:MAG: polysaccharide deacetylase family protein, partial [Myxococcota bacterium]